MARVGDLAQAGRYLTLGNRKSRSIGGLEKSPGANTQIDKNHALELH